MALMPRILEERTCLARVPLSSIFEQPLYVPSFDDSTRVHRLVCKRARVLYPSSLHHSAPLFSPLPLPHFLTHTLPLPLLVFSFFRPFSLSSFPLLLRGLVSPFLLFRSCLFSPPSKELSVRMEHRWCEREIGTNTETNRGREDTVGDPHRDRDRGGLPVSLTPTRTSRARSSERDPPREIVTEIATAIERR